MQLRSSRRTGLVLGLLLAVAVVALAAVRAHTVVRAQTDDGFDLSWWTVDGGGGTSQSSGYTLSGTAGQADAGALSGGGYTLSGGFWGGKVAPDQHRIFVPVVLRNRS